MAIILDNAATTGALIVRGPASGTAVLNVPATDAIVSDSMLVYDTGSSQFVMQPVPATVVVPTVVSAFTNDSGYQTAAQVSTAIAGKADTASLATVAFSGSYNDLSNKPTATSLGAVESTSVGVANGVASLDSNGLVPTSQLPSYVDDVLEFADFASLPGTGESGKIYITVDTTPAKQWRWTGSAYSEMVASPGTTDAVPEGSTNLYFTNGRAAAAAPVQSVAGKTGTVTLVPGDITGLATVATSGSYNDLSDKPTVPTAVSQLTNDSGYQTAAQVSTAIAGKADTASLATVAFSGSYNDLTAKPTIPTVVSAFTNDAGYLTAVPVATSVVLGGVKQGTGVSIAGDGTLTVTGEVADPGTPTNTTTTAVATVSTTDDTDTLALNVAMTDNSVILFTADVAVKNGNGTTGGGYSLQGVIRRASGVASVSLIGGAMKSIIAEDVTTWDTSAVANTTTGNLEIRVKGAAANNLMWFVAARLTRIS